MSLYARAGVSLGCCWGIMNLPWYDHISYQDGCASWWCIWTISASPWSQSCLLLIFKMNCWSYACEMVSHSRICIFIINEIEHLFLCLLATCVSSWLNYLFTFFAFASIMLTFFLLVVVVHCVFWLLIIYQSLCRDRLQVPCLSFTLFMVYVGAQTSLILM